MLKICLLLRTFSVSAKLYAYKKGVIKQILFVRLVMMFELTDHLMKLHLRFDRN